MNSQKQTSLKFPYSTSKNNYTYTPKLYRLDRTFHLITQAVLIQGKQHKNRSYIGERGRRKIVQQIVVWRLLFRPPEINNGGPRHVEVKPVSICIGLRWRTHDFHQKSDRMYCKFNFEINISFCISKLMNFIIYFCCM